MDRLRDLSASGLGTILVGGLPRVRATSPASTATVPDRRGVVHVRSARGRDAGAGGSRHRSAQQRSGVLGLRKHCEKLPLPRASRRGLIALVDPGRGWAAPDEDLGRLVLHGSGSIDSPLPCTPRAVIELVERHGIDLAGRTCVVIGLLLMRKE